MNMNLIGTVIKSVQGLLFWTRQNMSAIFVVL